MEKESIGLEQDYQDETKKQLSVIKEVSILRQSNVLDPAINKFLSDPRLNGGSLIRLSLERVDTSFLVQFNLNDI